MDSSLHRLFAAGLLLTSLVGCGGDPPPAPKAEEVEFKELTDGRYQVPKAWYCPAATT